MTKPGGDEPATLKALGAGPDHVSTPTTTSTPPQSSTTPSTPKPPNNLCRFFASEKGGRRGKECKYPYTWNLLDKEVPQLWRSGPQSQRVQGARRWFRRIQRGSAWWPCWGQRYRSYVKHIANFRAYIPGG